MSNVRVESTRNFVKQESVQYIRAITIELRLYDARPNARMYVYFNGENVSYLCGMVGNGKNTPIITDEFGRTIINFEIPADKYNVGDYEIIISDAPSLSLVESTGSVYGSARGKFSSSGKVEYYQTTKTTITTVKVNRPVPDPLAQSFFTYGNPKGLFLSSIDLYFQTKDETVPVQVDVRPLINGYPASAPLDNKNFTSTLNPEAVHVSDDASVATKFVFNPPIYLPGNSDFCFVVFANSKDYNIFTSRLGERSIENGLTIFEQPYVGSLFKSENNITWTAEQFEDIKFDLYRAEFDVNTSSIAEYALDVPYTSAYGEQFVTTQDSKIVRYTHTKKHGLTSSSYIEVIAPKGEKYSFNGIPSVNISGVFAITSVIDDNTVEFQCTANATSTGVISTSNGISHIYVSNEGSGYTDSTTVSISGGSGSGATADAVVQDGQVKEIIITDPGTGYLRNPSVTISGVGSGATALAFVRPTFSVLVNKPMQAFSPNLKIYNFGNTKTKNTFFTTIGNFDGGNLTPYTQGKQVNFSEDEYYVDLKQNSLVSSYVNESLVMSGNKSGKVEVTLISDDSKLSPIIDTRYDPEFIVYNKKINNSTTDETLPESGASHSRYITKKISLETISDGIRLFSDITSYQNSSVNWYIKTSLSSSGVSHDDEPWQLLTCDVARNRSGDNDEIFEYTFYKDNIPAFDTYTLKCVLTTNNPIKSPIVYNYRVIIIS
jgi:hypothetical protein